MPVDVSESQTTKMSRMSDPSMDLVTRQCQQQWMQIKAT